jgi:hypothetical protein
MALVWACPMLVGAGLCSCLPGHAFYLRRRNCAVIYGKEKVYGSIP